MQVRSQENSGIAQSIWIIKSKPSKDIDQNSRIVKHLRSAADQLPKDSPGIVHIQAPYKQATHFLSVADNARSTIERELRNHKHVAAVVIDGRFINRTAHIEGIPVEHIHTVIPNFLCKFQLPVDFKIVGTSIRDKFLDGHSNKPISSYTQKMGIRRRGMLTAQFKIDPKYPEVPARYVIKHCSPDGREQIHILECGRRIFMVEITSEETGYLSKSIDLSHLEVSTPYLLTASWDERGIQCSVCPES
jgi:hypothetical protein